MQNSFLKKNKTVLITSGNSLVGNELINLLIEEKIKVIALYRKNFKKKKHSYLIQIKHDFTKKFFINKKIDILVNCIATHEFSKKKTIHDYSSSNILSVIKMINYVKKQKIPLVINLSTISVQKNIGYEIKENSFDIDNTLLAITKFAGEKLFKLSGINIINLRLPGILVKNSKNFNRPWLLKIIKHLKNQKKIKIFNMNKKFNSLVDVYEIFNLIKFCLNKNINEYGNFNLSASGNIKLEKIINFLKDNLKSKSLIKEYRSNEKKSSEISLIKIRKLLKYNPSSVKSILYRFLK
jgi:nucleoside-diphosphate-sugar epimerase